MKRRIRAAALSLVLAATVATNSGCWGARELKDLSVVVGIGIDSSPNTSDKVQMTVQIARPSALKSATGQGGGGGDKAYWNLQYTGDTVFDDVRGFTHETHNKLYTAHNQVILFGRDAAINGVQKYIDFFLRAQETRPTLNIAVSETNAADILAVKPELDQMPAVNLSSLLEQQGFTSQSMQVTLHQFTNSLLSKTTAGIAPLVEVAESNGEQVIYASGLAVFKKDKMVGELNGTEARGLLWVLGKVQTGIVKIPVPDGIVSVEIKQCISRVKPLSTDDGKVRMLVDVKEEGRLASVTGKESYATIERFAVLEKLEEELIRNEIAEAVDRARQMNADFFGFGEDVHKSGTKNWKELEKNWDTIFPNIEVVLNIECNIRSAGNITEVNLP